MAKSDWIWRGLFALAGCIAAAYIGAELLGGEALGWVVGGAVLFVTCGPLFRALLARHAERHRRYTERRGKG